MPFAAFEELGYLYHAARGQKGYNGVAILSKLPIREEFSEDFANLGHARHVAAVLENGITIHNFYVPAGGDEPNMETNLKFAQKINFQIPGKDEFTKYHKTLNQTRKKYNLTKYAYTQHTK